MSSDASMDGGRPGQPGTGRQLFPAMRLVYALGFAFVAWFVFWTVIVLAMIQFVVIAVDGRGSDELKGMSERFVAYLSELLEYMIFTRLERPFPFSPFPGARAAGV